MHYWKGVITHLGMVSVQPLYYLTRLTINPAFFKNVSTTWTAVSVMIWLFILTRITIPFFRSPLRRLVSGPDERWIKCHLKFHKTPPTDAVTEMIKNTPNDGIISFWLPLYLRCQIIVTTTSAILDMLNTHSYDWEKPPRSRRFLAKVLGEGLVNVEGNQHKAMRKAVAPAFSGKHIRDLVPIFYSKGLKCADALAREFKSSADGALEIGERMSRVTLDIIGAAGVGKDFNTVDNDKDFLASLYHIITRPINVNLLLFFLIESLVPREIIMLFKGTDHAEKAESQIKLRAEACKLMQEKRDMLRDKPEQQHDIIATILRSGDFSDDYLVDQLLTFLAAGHDTTASALTWASYILCIHPEIQDRLRAECTAQIGNKPDSEITAADFDKETLPYLSAVCSETLRFYPTVPATERVSVRETRIGSQVIPKGTHAVIHIWAVNHDASIWGPTADKFDPQRWLDGPNAVNGGALSSTAFLTFLHGPRSCIGQVFAFTEMKCLLAILVTRFRFELADPTFKAEVGGFVTIKPAGGLKLKLHDLREEVGSGKVY